ncbi:MAG: ABC transporter permease [Candidatus Aminicenantes bacterium]|nr:ABC transporter permease [Candidatus Aminicenantes bacterium]
MLRNYIKTALRNISRNKFYSFLNIAGLAIGIACCILIFLYVQDELSYDRFHDNADNIYRIAPVFSTSERVMYLATCAHAQAPMLKDRYPEIVNYTRFTSYGSSKIIRYEQNIFTEEKFLWVDQSLLEVFSFKLIKGNPEDALVRPDSVIITEEIAKKYFGDQDPLGKNLEVNGSALYSVTGVFEDLPKTSHLRPDFFASFSTLNLKPTGNSIEDLLGEINYYTYLLLREGTDPLELEQKFDGFVEEQIGEILKHIGSTAKFELQPLRSIHLHSQRENELERNSDMTYVYLFIGIGLFILLLACMNFMNLATARSSNRAKEVGLRKVVGAQKPQLIRQFLGESFILTFIALIFSLVLVLLTLQVFRNISGKEISINVFSNPILILGLLGLLIAVGFIGGSYPAFFLSAFRPVEVIQGKFKRGAKSSGLRIILVSLQFIVSIVLIIGTLVVNRQLNYIRGKDLGYNKEHVAVIKVRNENTRKKMEYIKSDLLQSPDIVKVSASDTIPLGINDYSIHHAVGKPPEEHIMLASQRVDEDYLDAHEIELITGRNFSRDFPSDPEESIIINEAAVKKLGWQNNPLGQQIERYTDAIGTTKRYKVIGVLRDYHFQSLHEEIMPMVLYNRGYSGNFSQLSVRIKPDNIHKTMEFLETKWKEFDPVYPFEFEFADDQFDSLYRTEGRLQQLFGYFTALAIVIGCLGLFGLISFTTEQRRKEIGIRKVLGASVPNLILMQIRDITKWVFLAVLIAWPVGYYVMNNWLQNFAYRTNLTIWTFLAAALMALLISLFTISYQAIRAAYTDPAEAMKYE